MNEKAELDRQKKEDARRQQDYKKQQLDELRAQKANDREAQRQKMRQDLKTKRKQWGGGGADVQVEIMGAKEFDEAMAQSIKEEPNQQFSED